MPSCDFLPSFFALTLVTVAPARAQVDVDASGQATFSGNARFTAAIGVGVDPNASVTRVLIHHTATTFDGSGLRVVGSAPSSQFVRGLVSTLATTPGWGVAGAFEGGWVGVYGQASGAPDIFPAGVYGIAAGGTGNMGVRGVANGTGMGTTNYGVIGTAVGGSVTNVGVYGETEASPGVGMRATSTETCT